MKIWVRLTLLFGLLQLVIMLGVGAATLTVVRSLEEVGQGDLTHDIKGDNWSKETRLASQLLECRMSCVLRPSKSIA